MSQTIERVVQFGRQAHGRRTLAPATTPPPRVTSRIPRVTRLLALAHRLEGYIRNGVVARQSDLAQLGHVSTARISQILNLINLAPDIQEAILFLPPMQSGRDTIILHQLQPIAS